MKASDFSKPFLFEWASAPFLRSSAPFGRMNVPNRATSDPTPSANDPNRHQNVPNLTFYLRLKTYKKAEIN